MSAEHDFTFCATDWQGMSKLDIPNAINILQEFSRFPSLADRLQQGMVNTLYLGRLLAHPQGFAANAAFQGPGGQALLDTSNLYFDSNSQGGILGGLATAIAPDWTRAVLGVAAMNYALLLPRSVDFDTYVHPDGDRLPGRGHAPDHPLARPDAVGPRRDERLDASTSPPSRRRTRPSTPCSCTSRSATTRWPP